MKFLTTLLLVLSFGAYAGSECDADAKKFCANTDPGKGQLAKCLMNYEGQLSAACSKDLKAFRTKTLGNNPCFDELTEMCADIPAVNRKLEYCLMKNESRLGAKCLADFKKKKPNIIVKDVCAQDIVNTCYTTVSESDASTGRCLIKNRAKLSGFCQKKTDKRIADMKKSNPCFDETEKFCPTQIRFHEIHECMEKKISSLSPACKAVVNKEMEKEKSNPCYVDLRKHCKPGISSGEQHRCLEINEKELSPSCKQFRVKEAGKIQSMVKLCEADRLKLCPKAPFQNGLVIKCLKENASKVSAACKALL